MKKIRTAVVGLSLGLDHAKEYFNSEHAELSWVVDLDEAKAAKIAEELGCKYATNMDDILNEVDAVSICTPHHLHASQALKAINAGKHVLIEKPLANTEAECLQLIQAAEEQGVILMAAYIVRYMPHMRRLKQIIDSEEFGKVFNVNGWLEANLEPRPGSWFSRKDSLGGGVLFSHGCHYMDILRWIMGTPVHVTAMGTRLGTEWMEGEGTSHSLMKFEGDALGHMVCSWGMKYKDTPARFQFHTPEAVIILKGYQIDVITEEGRRTLFDPKEHPMASPFSYEIEHFLESIQTGNRPETDGVEGLKSLRMIWRMYEEQNKIGI